MSATDPSTAAPTSAAQVLAHVRYRNPGIDKAKALVLTAYCQALTLAWRGDPLFGERILATEYGPVPEGLHAQFGFTAPRKFPDTAAASGTEAAPGQRRRELDAVIAHYGVLGSTDLVNLSTAEEPYTAAVASGPESPAYTTGPVVSVEAMAEYYAGLPVAQVGQAEGKGTAAAVGAVGAARAPGADVEAGATGAPGAIGAVSVDPRESAPARPGETEAQAELDLEKAKALRAQLAARFEDTPNLLA
ncbi:Panacea domain-containing protein [Brevibacterium samyangense]|uniref:DUF4065 domain-containing protein n=1 Tax=Brevibacterium samyangense TaxID=366888 RepID=A0ABP5F231_9MICO